MQTPISQLEAASKNAAKPNLKKNVFLVGMTSLFTDIASEMIYPLIQAFMAMVLASQKALLGPVLGIIEGIAESTASLLKVVVGYYSDKFQKRKLPAIGGYGLSFIGRLILFAASSGWYFVLLSRFVDRVGKGIRTAPRDAIIAESCDKNAQGKMFGFHRAMDFLGAALGVFIAYFVARRYLDPATGNLKDLGSFYVLFSISVVPAFIGLIFLMMVRETAGMTHPAGNKSRPKPNLDIRKYDKNLRYFFFATILFTLGNSSNQFLLLRSMDLGHALSTVLLMYMVFNMVPTMFSTLFGHISDKIGRKTIMVVGYLIYTGVYSSFGLLTADKSNFIWIFWIIYGLYYSLTEGIEKAFISDLAPTDSKATALGFFHTIVGAGLLPASIIAGFLFKINASAPFIFGGAMSFISVLVIMLFVKNKPVQA